MYFKTEDEKRRDYLYDVLVEYGVATEDEISLVTCINGWNEESLLDILFARTGNRNLEQFLGEVDE